MKDRNKVFNTLQAGPNSRREIMDVASYSRSLDITYNSEYSREKPELLHKITHLETAVNIPPRSV